jgi:MFS family permease
MSCFIVNDPRERGIGPDGFPLAIGDPLRVSAGASLWEAIRSSQFVGLYAACLICSFGVFIPFVHLVPYALDHHIDQPGAVLLLGIIGVGSTLGRFFLGSLADQIGRPSFLLMMFIGMAGSLAIWVIATNFWSLSAFALLFGIFYGGWVAILPTVVMDHFGGRHVSSIIGVLYTSVAIGT